MAEINENDSRVCARRDSCIKHYHSIYNPTELAHAVQQLKGNAPGTSDRNGEQPDDREWHVENDMAATLTSEDLNRCRTLARVASDPRGHRRHSIIGSSEMVRRIAALSKSIPHFSPAIDLVRRAALVSARTETSLRLPPILLLGEPGIGKTYALRRLAKAIGADFSLIAANMTDPFRLRGMNTAWRGARMGRVAEILLAATTAPIVLVDEFDKAVGDRVERPYDIWHSLLERENAAVFVDDFLEIELRADQIMWMASANDISVLPSSIQDRLLVLEIPAPNRDQLGIIVASIYADCGKAYGGKLPEHLDEVVLEELSRHNPRRIRRLIDLAVGYAAGRGRQRLSVEDIRSAYKLAGESRSAGAGFRGPVGFSYS